MHTMQRLTKRARTVAIAITAISMIVGNMASVTAASLSSASLELSDPRPSQSSSYTFSASGFSGSAQCIDLELSDTAGSGGSVPTGLTSTGASLDAGSTMITPASWTSDFTTNGLLRLTNVSGETPSDAGTLVFNSVTNGSTESTTYYGNFTTYSDAACTTQLDEVIVAFVYQDGELVSLTIDPTLTFALAGVAAASTVNGTTVTHLADASGIDYQNDVNASTNGVSAHDVSVTTNATNGYSVYLRHTGDLTNANSDTIDNHTGTNASPSAFPAAGTEAWGYTTEDGSLEALSVDRFTNPGNLWAGFTTSNAEVLYNSAAVPGTETVRVGHQVGVSSNTEAGTYQTTIVYTVVATF